MSYDSDMQSRQAAALAEADRLLSAGDREGARHRYDEHVDHLAHELYGWSITRERVTVLLQYESGETTLDQCGRLLELYAGSLQQLLGRAVAARTRYFN